MKFLERKEIILNSLKENAICSVHSMVAKMNVSEATVRRDFHDIENDGLLKRVHGGAISVNTTEPFFAVKETTNKDEKEKIAKLALSLINNDDHIYLDGGSTVLCLARMLDSRKHLTIVTNSVLAAATLVDYGHKIVLVGGELRSISRTLVGPLTEPIINSLRVDKAFMGTIGLTLEDGLSTTDPGEAFTKTLIMKRSKQVIILADSAKIGVSSFALSGKLEDIDILVSNFVPKKYADEFYKKNVKIILTENQKGELNNE